MNLIIRMCAFSNFAVAGSAENAGGAGGGHRPRQHMSATSAVGQCTSFVLPQSGILSLSLFSQTESGLASNQKALLYVSSEWMCSKKKERESCLTLTWWCSCLNRLRCLLVFFCFLLFVSISIIKKQIFVCQLRKEVKNVSFKCFFSICCRIPSSVLMITVTSDLGQQRVCDTKNSQCCEHLPYFTAQMNVVY